MAKAHQGSAKSKQDALQEHDYLILEQSRSRYLLSVAFNEDK